MLGSQRRPGSESGTSWSSAASSDWAGHTGGESLLVGRWRGLGPDWPGRREAVGCGVKRVAAPGLGASQELGARTRSLVGPAPWGPTSAPTAQPCSRVASCSCCCSQPRRFRPDAPRRWSWVRHGSSSGSVRSCVGSTGYGGRGDCLPGLHLLQARGRGTSDRLVIWVGPSTSCRTGRGCGPPLRHLPCRLWAK